MSNITVTVINQGWFKATNPNKRGKKLKIAKLTLARNKLTTKGTAMNKGRCTHWQTIIPSYKIYSNKISMLTRMAKERYFHKYLHESFSNTKKIWEGINSLLRRESKSRMDITTLKCLRTNQVSHNPSDFPDIMNKDFLSIGYNGLPRCQIHSNQFTEYLPELNFASSFFFNPVSPPDIELEIMTTPINKVHGLYSFRTCILSSARHTINRLN